MRRGLPANFDLEKDPYSLYEGVEYAQFWTGLQKCNLDTLEHTIVRHLLPVSGRRVLDVGCGYGRLSDCYEGRFQQVIMVDGSMSLLHQAVEKTERKAVYVAADAYHLPFRAASFDAVLMIRVFHHMQDSQACLLELHRVLCHRGRFVFSYLNKHNMLRVIRWLIGRNKDHPFATEPSGQGTTFISHHPRAVQKLLDETGFSQQQYYGIGVVDRFAHLTGTGNPWTALGECLAPFLAWSGLAPWMLCGADAGGGPELLAVPGIGDLLQCPSCGGSLCDEKDAYRCIACRKHYPIVDGIIDLRVR